MPDHSPNKFEFKAPALDVVRAEVAHNPHVTPPSLVRFALAMGNRMDVALRSEVQAKAFFPELASCVAGKGDSAGSVQSVRALCLTNAHVLENHYPSLNSDYRRLRQDADPKIVRISDAIE